MFENHAQAGAAMLQQHADHVAQYPAGSKAAGQSVAPDTLLSAMASVDGLTKRLAEVHGQVHEIAMVIGGPFPCNAAVKQQDSQPSPNAPPAMYVLNRRLGAAHESVSEIIEAVQAIRRALGA